MGRPVHNRLDWELDHCSTVGLDWRRKDRYTRKSLLLPALDFLKIR